MIELALAAERPVAELYALEPGDLATLVDVLEARARG